MKTKILGPGRIPGRFFLSPLYLGSIVVLVANNFWFKHSGICPVLAGKLSDIAIMIFLPALISVGVLFLRYVRDWLSAVFEGDPDRQIDFPDRPSKSTLIAALIVSGALMTAMKTSDTAMEIYYQSLNFLNTALLGRTIARPVKDYTDLVSLLFLAVPWLHLSEAPLISRWRRFRLL